MQKPLILAKCEYELLRPGCRCVICANNEDLTDSPTHQRQTAQESLCAWEGTMNLSAMRRRNENSQISGHRPEEAPLWKSSHLGPDRTAERQLSSFYIIFFIVRKDKIKDRTKWPGLTFELPGPAAGELLLCSFFVSVSVSWTEMSQNPDKGGKVHGILSGEKYFLFTLHSVTWPVPESRPLQLKWVDVTVLALSVQKQVIPVITAGCRTPRRKRLLWFCLRWGSWPNLRALQSRQGCDTEGDRQSEALGHWRPSESHRLCFKSLDFYKETRPVCFSAKVSLSACMMFKSGHIKAGLL